MKNKRLISLIVGVLVIIVVAVIIICLLNGNKGNNGAWSKEVKKYKDSSVLVEDKKDTYYAKEFVVQDKKLYGIINVTEDDYDYINVKDDKKGYFILDNIIKVYVVEYSGLKYTYAVSSEGKTYYINNITGSTASRFEITELGDFIYIKNIYNSDNKIVGEDINKNIKEISEYVESYSGYNLNNNIPVEGETEENNGEPSVDDTQNNG